MGKYLLMVAEKPAAAERIATALDYSEKPEKHEMNGVPYFVASRDRQIVVASALGHLYTVSQRTGSRNQYPIFDLKWAPRFEVEKKARWTEAWINTISALALKADGFIDACDYDLEGSLIGYNVINYACDGAHGARRMKYSALTKDELIRAYENLQPTLDFELAKAARVRHEVDWLYGINLSRALSLSMKRASGRYMALSAGRVQGPTLNFLTQREDSISCFVPTPYWAMKAEITIRGRPFRADYKKGVLKTKAEADAVVEACRKKTGRIVKVEERTLKQLPPPPFDSGGLQREAYRLFKFPPRRTSNIAERLYLDALISYPRTSSQKLPPTINYRSILRRLSESSAHRRSALELLSLKELWPREGKTVDPAHPAVYPTGNLPTRKLSAPERRLWTLVVKRFMAAFGEPARQRSVKVEIDVEKHIFLLEGRTITHEGWLRLYKPYVSFNEISIPRVKEGATVCVDEIFCEYKLTRPPPRYNPGSLLRKMETEKIGTKATRANIIHTLYSRKYISEDNIKVTELGRTVAHILQQYAPTIASTELTRLLEERMQRIQKGVENPEAVLAETISRLKPVFAEFRNHEQLIGGLLNEATKKTRLKENAIGSCPTCEDGRLIILRSRKTGKRFAGCTGYFTGACQTSFPLPQQGTVKPTRKRCKTCGGPIVLVFRKRKKPWIICLNPACPAKEGGRKKGRKRLGEM